MKDLLFSSFLSFSSLFVVVDPFSLIPSFLVMTRENSVAEKISMARTASVVTFCILLAFLFLGDFLFRIFGITLPAFEIAGGIILLLIALDMLQARKTAVKETPEEEAEGINKSDIAVTPLAVPMLAGPGSITTVVLFASRCQSLQDYLILVINIFLVSLTTFLVLRFVSYRSKSISLIGLKVMTRLMGLLLTAFAVQFVLNGIIHSKILNN